jgi:hypothetical protein
MIRISNTEQFIKALELSHKNDKAFEQFMNFLKRMTTDQNDILFIYPIIGGSEKFIGWGMGNINGGLLYDEDNQSWSSHT